MAKRQTSPAASRGKRVATSVLRKLRRARSKDAINRALIDIELETDDLKLHQLPPLLRKLDVARNFADLIDVYGIERFFFNWPKPYAAYSDEAIAWYRTIGAARAARYLQRAVALFPKGKPPAESGEALEAMDRIKERRPTAFSDLDRKFRGATTELMRRVRVYVLSHAAELRAELVGGEIMADEARTLPAVLGVKDPLEFLDAAREMVRHAIGLGNTPDWLTEEPNAANTLLVLRGLYLDLSMEGTWKFLDSGMGSLTHDAEAWCRAIGAKRAAKYLAETAKLFPRGRIPRDDVRRQDLVEVLSERRNGKPDRLGRLDRKYAGAVEEMVDALREYLRTHAKNPVDALERVTRLGRTRRYA
jgi:hypothetical protein